jgi:hypothetical protein
MSHSMLIPREHGAYGQLTLPLITVVLAGHPGALTWAIAAAAACGFLAQEGLAVLAGRRGSRAAREQRRAAFQAAAVFGGACVTIGAGALLASPPLVRHAVIGAAALAAVVMAVVRARLERTLVGEALVSVALTVWCLPAGLAAGLGVRDAAGGWAVWSVSFAVATLGVRGLIARTRREPWRWLSAGAVIVGAAGWWVLHRLALAGSVSAGLPLALAPAGVLSVALWLTPLRAHHLRRIGWTIVAAGLVTLALLLRSV